MRLKCLGGFGEQGRSALLVEGKSCFLVDYGVKKTVGEGILGELPLEDFPELDFIVVTHAHQDHTAMLPLLVEKGINVPIYATPPTKEFTITYCESWHKSYESHGLVPPYDKQSIYELEKLFVTKPYFQEFEAGKGTLITFFPSGHLVGSAIVHIKDEKTIAHFGDINFNDAINPEPYLDFDAEIGIINGSYGDKIMPKELLEKKFIENVTSGRFNVLIPSAALGRGQVVCLLLLENLSKIDKEIYISKSIIENTKRVLKYPHYIKPEAIGMLNKLVDSPYFKIIDESKLNDLVEKGAIFIAPDAMLSSGPALKIFNLLKDKPQNKIILSGFLAPGTLGRKLAEGEVSINAVLSLSELKVHTDLADNKFIINKTLSNAKLILIHHGEEPKSTNLANKLREKFNLDIRSPHFGDAIII